MLSMYPIHVNRSIPACAGEPSSSPTPRARPTVYPRVCGGTEEWTEEDFNVSGLSPRVRGNLAHDGLALELVRSIPACAGEPHAPRAVTSRLTVYPRVCGGTI